MKFWAKSCLGTLTGLAVLAGGSFALAAPIQSPWSTILTAAEGYDPDGLNPDGTPDEGNTQNTGPGFEQAVSTYIQKGEDVYVVTISMRSNVEVGNWQGYCSSVKLSPGQMPQQVADTQISAYANGDRNFNHSTSLGSLFTVTARTRTARTCAVTFV